MSQEAVIYARYSSENQRETSIEDQVRECKQFAEKNSWSVGAEYADMEMSGRIDDRPQCKLMIEDAKRGKFEILIVYDLSRLSRSTNTTTLIEELRYYGVRVISISDGIDSFTKGSKLLIGMKAMMNNSFLDQMKENVHRGLEGKALNGYNAGGRSYGYTHVPHYSTTQFDIYGRAEIEYVTRRIDDEQAKWVRQIFEWVAEGRSYKWVATELNRLQVKSLLGGNWTTSTVCGGGDNPHGGILNNPLYIGTYYWNRTETTYNPVTGQAKTRRRDEKEWVKKILPELRIINDELWLSVKARQEARRASTKIKRGELHHNARTGPGPKFILSGLLKCSECGGDFIISSPGKYKCGNAHRRGDSICQNSQTLLKNEVEEKLLESLKLDMFTPEAVNVFKTEVASLLKKRKLEFEPTIKKIKDQLKDVDMRINNLIDAIETSGLDSTILPSRLNDLGSKKKDLETELTTQTSYLLDIEPFIPRAVDRYKELVKNLPEACKGHAAPVREKLKILLGAEVTMRKTEHGGWEGTYRGSYSGLIRLGASNVEISDETLSDGLLFNWSRHS